MTLSSRDGKDEDYTYRLEKLNDKISLLQFQVDEIPGEGLGIRFISCSESVDLSGGR